MSLKSLKMLKNNIQYSLVDSGELESDHWAIRIDGGPFKDVVYKYMVIEMLEEDVNGFKPIRFKYQIMEDSADLVSNDVKEFEETAKHILDAILQEEN